ncbi:MAG: hypothetical protein WBZ57_02420, partial [Pseudomonas graminis]
MPDQTPTPSLSDLAARLFRVRAAQWEKRVRAGEATRDQANARLRPWLALACMAHADLPHYADLLAERRTVDIAFPELLRLNEGRIRSLVAADIAPRAQVLAVLTAARDKAFDDLPDQGDPNSPQSEQASALN